MIDKQVIVDRVEVLEDGTMQVREVVRIVEDGVVIAETHHRSIATPDMDVTDKPEKVKKIAGVLWTKEVKDKYKAKLARAEAEG